MDNDGVDDETSNLLSGIASASRSTSKSANYAKDRAGLVSRIFCCRNVLAILQFWGFVTVYGMRANLSVALVAMVNQTYAQQTSGHRIIEPECRVKHQNATLDDHNEVCIQPVVGLSKYNNNVIM